jgi:hypothetical protein
VPANASDAVYCTVLAQSAVHGAMAGLTGAFLRLHLAALKAIERLVY